MKIWRFLRGQGSWIDGVWLSAEEQQTLVAVHHGDALRSQRDIEGQKRYELRGDSTVCVSREAVLNLRKKRLVETNHKFPSATFLLTTRGREIAMILTDDAGSNPVGAQDFIGRK